MTFRRSLCLFGLALMLLGSPAASAESKCLWALDMDRVYCAPTYGDVVHDINSGRFLCAPGQCVINGSGKFRCSSVPGGAAVLDSRNRAACVGGCQEPAENFCFAPAP